ncbi:Solute carrier organic anion transporter family member 1B2 [Araneus ventricosus]|uniref:Solute carrier organic anion transporter family member n=1 Tax=Araneus ventricosus TaxID=182803 RepID=A0A4Y2BQL6_ARAVE|nr:Solute carrier organic anion transporter family member 1B2 [Araneus ventricosus]
MSDGIKGNQPNGSTSDCSSTLNNLTHASQDKLEENPGLFAENSSRSNGAENPAFNDQTVNKTIGSENLGHSIRLSELMKVSKGHTNLKENAETPAEDSHEDERNRKYGLSKPQYQNGVFLEVPLKNTQYSEESLNNLGKSTDCVLKDVNSNCDVDPDTLCGIGSFKPQWLQPWATPRVFLFLYSLLGVISGTYYAYRIGAISTLEKRFSFNSRISGTIMMVDEVTPVFMGALIGYFGGMAHRPRMFAIGMLLTALCCFVSALPYFIYGPTQHLSSLNIKNDTEVELCESEITRERCLAEDRPPTIAAIAMLMIAGFLKGFGNLSYHAVGLSFLDDSAKKKNASFYFAITFALRLVGPMIGFLMSSYFLKIHENPFDDPGYGPEDPRWIGAWWLGFLVQGLILLVCTIPLALFPKRLPGQKIHQDISKEKGPSLTGLIAASKRILKNPLFITIVLNDIMTIFGSMGHFVMLPKYMEHQFRLTASDASLLSGPPGIAAVMSATVIGGYLVWKYRPTAKFVIASMIAMEAVSALGFVLLMIPKCDKVEMANFGLNREGLILDSECNFNCTCTTKAFSPICGSDGRTVYFTPCFAGCRENVNQTFSDCSCISEPSGQQASNATEGLCVTDDCWSQALGYIITLPIIQFISSLLRLQHIVLLLRSVLPEDKSIALGMLEALICIFGFVPYLVIFGSLVDSTCLVWEKSCGEYGNCWFYDTDKFNNLLHALSAVFSSFAALSLVATYFLSGRIGELYEDDNDGNEATNKKELEAAKGETQMNTRTKL